MDPSSQTHLDTLMKFSSGDPYIKIGLIDGPLDLDHPAFSQSRIDVVKPSQIAICKDKTTDSCLHGTFIVGILSSMRGLAVPALCPRCPILLYPIFKEANTNPSYPFPSATPEELSTAIIETIDAGAKIINLSLGLSTSSMTSYPVLIEAYEYALRKNVIIVSAAGNQGSIGSISLINHPWVIPVASCNEYGNLDPNSNFGPSIANRGVMAPGVNIRSTSPGGRYSVMSGTSFAAPFVTATVALLFSIFRNAPAEVVRSSLLVCPSRTRNRTVIPPLLNAEAALNHIMCERV